MLDAIGKTPLVRLHRVVGLDSAEVWLKLEYLNPTGSQKDRLALAMVRHAAPDLGTRRLLECTGGSTGSSLAFVCAVLGLPLTIISSNAYAREKLDSMRAFGAELLVEPAHDGRVTPDLWPRMRERARVLEAAGTHLWLDQFCNPVATSAYHPLAREILSDGPVHGFCAAVGTAGMVVGVGQILRVADPGVRVVALEPASSAVLSGGPAGSHTIDGTAAGFIPPGYDPSVVTEARAFDEAHARAMCRRLVREEGVFAGTSTGLNVLGALELAAEIGPGGRVVTVACDTGFKYLDGPLYRA